MVAVQDKETLAELSRLNAAVMGTQNDPFYGVTHRGVGPGREE